MAVAEKTAAIYKAEEAEIAAEAVGTADAAVTGAAVKVKVTAPAALTSVEA